MGNNNHKGFSLAEIIITITLLTIVVGPVISTYVAGLKSTDIAQKDFNMDILGKELMDEIILKNYEDVEFYGNIGRETGENDRKQFDDIDDYLDYVEDFGEIVDISGDLEPDYANYKRYVEIYNEEGKKLSEEDGLRFEYSILDPAFFETNAIKISRDGNRLFGINVTEKKIFVMNPFSQEIETELLIEDTPLNIELTPDSKTLYVNYGNKIEIYSYYPGQFKKINTIYGGEYASINKISIVNGELVYGTDKGIYINNHLYLNGIENIDHIYSKLNYTVIGSQNSVNIVKNDDLNTPIFQKNINVGNYITSSYYDEYNGIIFITTSSDFVYSYNVNTQDWDNILNPELKELNGLFYSYADGEFYFGGNSASLSGLYGSRGGNINNASSLFNIGVQELEVSKDNKDIILRDNMNMYSMNLVDHTLKSWTNPGAGENISAFCQELDYIYVLTSAKLWKIDKSTMTSVKSFDLFGFIDVTIDNSKVYVTDGKSVFTITKELEDFTKLEQFNSIDSILCSRDGKKLYMLSKNSNKVYFLNTFNQKLDYIDTNINNMTQSASGNILIGNSDDVINKMFFIKNNTIKGNTQLDEPLVLTQGYDDVVNIDKSDSFAAFDLMNGKMDIYSYQDGYEDNFDFLSDQECVAFFQNESKGYNVNINFGELVIDTKSAIDTDNGSNICNILIYKTFVFPVPKFLRQIHVKTDFAYSGDKLELFVYSGAVNSEKFNNSNGNITDAHRIIDLTTQTNYDSDIDVPPTNMLTVGFRISDTNANSYAELALKHLKIDFNESRDIQRIKSISVPFNSIDAKALSWDNRFIYIASGNVLYVYDVILEKFVENKSVTISDADYIYDLQVSQDNNSIFVGTNTGLYKVFEPLKKKLIKVIVESKDRMVMPLVLYATASNWKTDHSDRVLPHLLPSEIINTDLVYNGHITEDTVWYSGKQYIIKGDLEIDEGKKLIIQPDCNIKFEKNATLIVAENASLYSSKSVFTSVNDNASGKIIDSSNGEPTKGDFNGLNIKTGGKLVFKDNLIKYAFVGVDIYDNSDVIIENNKFEANDYAVRVSNNNALDIKYNLFKFNNNDITASSFGGTLSDNYFLYTGNTCIKSDAGSVIDIKNNSFINILDEAYVAGINTSTILFENNNVINCSKGFLVTDSGVRCSMNSYSNSKFSLEWNANDNGKKVEILKNLFINGDNLLFFSKDLKNINFKGRMNFFIDCDEEVVNNSGFPVDMKYNYWGENSVDTKNFVQTAIKPFLIYGLLTANYTQDDSDIIVYHHIRVISGAEAEISNSNIILYSDIIEPFIECSKINDEPGIFTLEKCTFAQDSSEIAIDFADTDIEFNSSWQGIRVYGELSMSYCTFDKAENSVILYTNPNAAYNGASLRNCFFNNFKDNNNHVFLFDKGSTGNNSFKYDDIQCFYNKFDSRSDIVKITSGMGIPETKINLQYNYWKNNNINAPPINVDPQKIEFYPRAISGLVNSEIVIDDASYNPVIVLDNITLRSTMNFVLPESKVIFAGDHSFDSENGFIKGQVAFDSTNFAMSSPYDVFSRYYEKSEIEFNNVIDYEDTSEVETTFEYYWGNFPSLSDRLGIDNSVKPEGIAGLILNQFQSEPLKLTLNHGNFFLNDVFKMPPRFLESLDLIECNSFTDKELNSATADSNQTFTLLDSYMIHATDTYNIRLACILKAERTDFIYLSDNFFVDQSYNLSKVHSSNCEFSIDDVLNENINITDCNFKNYLSLNIDGKDNSVILTNNIFENNKNTNLAMKLTGKEIHLRDNKFGYLTSINSGNIVVDNLNKGGLDFSGFENLEFTNNIFLLGSESASSKDMSFSAYDGAQLNIINNVFFNKDREIYFNLVNSSFLHIYNNMFLNAYPYSKNQLNLKLENVPSAIIQGNRFSKESGIYATNSVNSVFKIGNNNFFGNNLINLPFNLSFSDVVTHMTMTNSIDYSMLMGNYYDYTNQTRDYYLYSFGLNNPVNIHKALDFEVESYDDSCFNDAITNPSFIINDKKITDFIISNTNSQTYSFGSFEVLLNHPEYSVASIIDREVRPLKAAEVPTTVDRIYIEFTQSGVDTYKSYFTINNDSKAPYQPNSTYFDWHIRGDWDDVLQVSIPATGTLNGKSSYPIPLPMPEAPEPPIDFKISSITCPINGYDIDGTVKVVWENNQDGLHPVFKYELELYRTSSGMVDGDEYFGDYIVKHITVAGSENVYTFEDLEPGKYYIIIKASNNSPESPTLNNNNYDVTGDTDLSGDAFEVALPPRIISPDVIYVSQNNSIVIDGFSGANLYTLSWISTDGTDRKGEKMSSSPVFNINPGIDNLTEGVWKFNVKMAYESGGVIIEESEYSRPKFILVKGIRPVVGIVVSEDTRISFGDYIFDSMLYPVQAINSSEIDANIVIVVDAKLLGDPYDTGDSWKEIDFNLDLYLNYVRANGFNNVTVIPTVSGMIYQEDFFDGIVCASNYILSNRFQRWIKDVYSGPMLGIDKPGVNTVERGFLTSLGIPSSVPNFDPFGDITIGVQYRQNHVVSTGIAPMEMFSSTLYRNGYLKDISSSSGVHVSTGDNARLMSFITSPDRRFFINMHLIPGYTQVYYEKFFVGGGSINLTHYDLFIRSLRWILNIVPPPPDPIVLTYYDINDKGKNDDTFFTKTFESNDGLSHVFYDLDCNVKREESDSIVPFLRWNPDKNVMYYNLEKTSNGVAGAYLGFRNFTNWEDAGMVRPSINPNNSYSTEITYRLTAYNSVGVNTSIDFSVYLSKKPNITTNEYGIYKEKQVSLPIEVDENGERAGYVHGVIACDHGIYGGHTEHYESSINENFDRFSNNTLSVPIDIPVNAYKFNGFLSSSSNENVEYEQSEEFTKQFIVHPPGPEFTSPQYNVSDSFGNKLYYEDWDGVFTLKWNYNTYDLVSGQYRIHLFYTFPGRTYHLVDNQANIYEYDVPAAVDGSFDLYAVYKSLVPSLHDDFQVKIAPKPTITCLEGNTIYLNQHEDIHFRASFIPKNGKQFKYKFTLEGPSGFHQEYDVAGTSGTTDFTYFNANNLPKGDFTAIIQAIALDGSDQTKNSSFNFSVKEYFKVQMLAQAVDPGKDTYGKVASAKFQFSYVFTYPNKAYRFKCIVTQPDDVEAWLDPDPWIHEKTGTEVRALPNSTVATSNTDRSYHERTFSMYVEVYRISNGELVYTTPVETKKADFDSGKTFLDKTVYIEF